MIHSCSVKALCSGLITFLIIIGGPFIKNIHAEPLKINIDTSIQKGADNNLLLHIRITNGEERKISIYQHDLPWISTHTMFLIAIDTSDHYKTFQQLVPFDDPPPNKTIVDIEGDSSLEGTIDLNSSFPGLSIENIKKHEIVIFWTYLAKLINNDQEFQRLGGWVRIAPQ